MPHVLQVTGPTSHCTLYPVGTDARLLHHGDEREKRHYVNVLVVSAEQAQFVRERGWVWFPTPVDLDNWLIDY